MVTREGNNVKRVLPAMYGFKKGLIGKSRSLIVVEGNAIPEIERKFEIAIKKLK